MSNSGNLPLIKKHISLEEVLRLATPDELHAIADILLAKSNDRLLGNDASRQKLARCHQEGQLYPAVNEIAFEIRALGSVSLASLLRRGEPVSYDEVVRDVASELKIKFSKQDTTARIEQMMLEMLAEKLAEQDVQVTTKPSTVASSFGSLLGPLSKSRLGRVGATVVGSALGSVAAAAMHKVLPLGAIGVVTASVLAVKNKARPELEGLTMITVHIARIRAGVVAADHEDFANRLRACV
ncbi:hypothetical protein [Pseudomonas psychrophila]|uniref:hypothetical protein n=1 Tax=Pseudomonas psychrophila TaxID=122355 RepID=UPI00031D1D44|nr:hypothetical protein [Pseudomonas psychrophila]